jgi:DNA ligase D-like protein (predicted ligase)
MSLFVAKPRPLALPSLGWIDTMQPTLVDKLPDLPGWSYEIKHDGYRTQMVIDAGGVRAFTRNGHDWTAKYPMVVEAAAGLPCRSAIIDGEIVVQDGKGVSDFTALRSALITAPDRVLFYAFDLLHLDGTDLRKRSTVERREVLRSLLEPSLTADSRIQLSDDLPGTAPQLIAAAMEIGLEGIIAKRQDAPYRSGRTFEWLKVKCMVTEPYIVLGTDRESKGPVVALLGKATPAGLEYCGQASVALPAEERAGLYAALEELATDKPFLKDKELRKKRSAAWVRPGLVAEVKHLKSGLRHATVTGYQRVKL